MRVIILIIVLLLLVLSGFFFPFLGFPFLLLGGCFFFLGTVIMLISKVFFQSLAHLSKYFFWTTGLLAAGLTASLFALPKDFETSGKTAEETLENLETSYLSDRFLLQMHFWAFLSAKTGKTLMVSQNLTERDAKRVSIVVSTAEKNLSSPKAAYKAAKILYNCGKKADDFSKGQQLAEKAAEANFAGAAWLAQACEDRYLLASGKSEKFGTQSKKDFDDWD